MGLVAGMGMTDNMLLKTYTHGKGPMVDRAPARKMAEELVEKAGYCHGRHRSPGAYDVRRQCAESAAGPGD